MKILVVDDEALLVKGIRFNLQNEGYEVITGSDGTPITVKLRFPELRGVAVVCRGGANPVNQEKIVSLLTALFGLPATRVCVTG